jgi:NitT/TauT family transport system permease protein
VWQQFHAVALRQITAQLAPVLAIASALSFKVAIMAELLTNVSGIGGALARARANLAVDEALAWIALAVMALLVVEYTALQPLRHRLERWRQLSAGA